MAYRAWLKGAAFAIGAISATALAQTASTPQPPASAPAYPPPYLAKSDTPDSEKLLPPPPAFGAPEMGRDSAGEADALKQQSGARWELARNDAKLDEASMDATFSCAAGIEITPTGTPALSRLLARARSDFGNSTGAAKIRYQRKRPFMMNGKPSCTPGDEAYLRTNGSYPSGHSAMGYGTALILAELFPANAQGLLERGRAFADSRRICNVHWLSDTEEGRFMAGATYARLHGDLGFQQDLSAARAEIAALKDKLPVKQDCAAEAGALH